MCLCPSHLGQSFLLRPRQVHVVYGDGRGGDVRGCEQPLQLRHNCGFTATLRSAKAHDERRHPCQKAEAAAAAAGCCRRLRLALTWLLFALPSVGVGVVGAVVQQLA